MLKNTSLLFHSKVWMPFTSSLVLRVFRVHLYHIQSSKGLPFDMDGYITEKPYAALALSAAAVSVSSQASDIILNQLQVRYAMEFFRDGGRDDSLVVPQFEEVNVRNYVIEYKDYARRLSDRQVDEIIAMAEAIPPTKGSRRRI